MKGKIILSGLVLLATITAIFFFLQQKKSADTGDPRLTGTREEVVKAAVKQAEKAVLLSEKDLKTLQNLILRSAGQSGKARPSELLVMPDEAQQELVQAEEVQLVDVRTAEEFKQCRIPGSLNIPLYSIKTKQFLKSRSVILVDVGYGHRVLEQEAVKLQERGFAEVRILAGGLVGWRDSGGKLEGDFFAIDSLDEIPPEKLFVDSVYTDWRFICFAEKGESVELQKRFPDALILTQYQEIGDVIGTLFDQTPETQETDFPYFLLVNGAEDTLQHVKGSFREAGLVNSYYLTGGLEAYGDYLKLQARMKQPGTVSVEKCETCP